MLNMYQIFILAFIRCSRYLLFDSYKSSYNDYSFYNQIKENKVEEEHVSYIDILSELERTDNFHALFLYILSVLAVFIICVSYFIKLDDFNEEDEEQEELDKYMDLPTITSIRKVEKHRIKDDNCIICFDKLQNTENIENKEKDYVISYGCKHQIHLNCFAQFIAISNNCQDTYEHRGLVSKCIQHFKCPLCSRKFMIYLPGNN